MISDKLRRAFSFFLAPEKHLVPLLSLSPSSEKNPRVSLPVRLTRRQLGDFGGTSSVTPTGYGYGQRPNPSYVANSSTLI